MKIIKILGGLGNQMFQYAFYIAMQKHFPNDVVKIDTHCFKGYPLHNGFELEEIFHLDYQAASLKDTANVAYPYFNYRIWQLGKYLLPLRKSMFFEKDFLTYYGEVFNDKSKEYFDGYWQNPNYFSGCANEVRRCFSFPSFNDEQNIRLSQRLASAQSLSIHVRRGDYLHSSLYKGICGLEYYKKAISFVLNRQNVDIICVFSDDITWCKQHLKQMTEGIETLFCDINAGKNSYRDMQLMSCCKYNIIANSSFSWWAAWLNSYENKIVVAPRKWINSSKETSMNLDKSWVKI